MMLQFLVIIKGHTDTSPVYILLHSKLPGHVRIKRGGAQGVRTPHPEKLQKYRVS